MARGLAAHQGLGPVFLIPPLHPPRLGRVAPVLPARAAAEKMIVPADRASHPGLASRFWLAMRSFRRNPPTRSHDPDRSSRGGLGARRSLTELS
jgi:hypothetical protein